MEVATIWCYEAHINQRAYTDHFNAHKTAAGKQKLLSGDRLLDIFHQRWSKHSLLEDSAQT